MSFTNSMKKVIMILSAVLAMGLLAICLTSCGNKNNTKIVTATQIEEAFSGKALSTVYNGQEQAINVEEIFNDLDITSEDLPISTSSVQILGYKIKDSTEDFATTAPRNAGEYVAQIKIEKTAQNQEFIGTIDYIIDKKVISNDHSSNITYDGQTTHSRMRCSVNIIEGDEVYRQFTVSSKNVGTYKKSNNQVEEETTGADAGNYEFTGDVTVTIQPKQLTGTVNFTKTYDQTTTFSAKALTSANGVIAGDVVLIAGTASGIIGNVSISQTTLSGADALNYTFAGTATGTITVANYIFPDSISYYTGRGALIIGTIDQGTFNVNDLVTVIFNDGTTKASVVTGISLDGTFTTGPQLINTATSANGKIYILLRGISNDESVNIYALVKA